MNTNHIGVLNQVSQNTKVPGKVLQEGSNVRVVITGDKGNGKYEGTVAGVKVNISSVKPMQIGSSFVAKVSSNSGVIVLTPQEAVNNIKIPELLLEVPNNQIKEYLSFLGLPQNDLASSILLQFKQLGLNLDAVVMRKIYMAAAKFKGKEKSAATIISILKSKGLDAAGEIIQQMLSQLEIESDLNRGFSSQQEMIVSQDIAVVLDKFRNFIFNGETEEEKIGSLTIMNHILKKEFNAKNWIFIPFEIVKADNSKSFGTGLIKLLFNDQMILNKLGLDFRGKQSYKFLLNYDNKRLDSVYFNIQNDKKEDMTEIGGKLKQIFPEVQIIGKDSDEMENTAALSEKMISLGGLV